MIGPSEHRALAVEANNSTWEFLEQSDLDPAGDDADEMTRRAYAAAYHWARAEGTTPANAARADWLLARVWAARRNGALALVHAERCLATCQSADLADFDAAYGHEAMARAFVCLDDVGQAREHLRIARGVPIADAVDRRAVEADLDALASSRTDVFGEDRD